MFFLLSHFLLVEEYELSKSTGHLLSALCSKCAIFESLLTMEWIRIPYWSDSLFFTSIVSQIIFCKRLLIKLITLLLNYHVTNPCCWDPSSKPPLHPSPFFRFPWCIDKEAPSSPLVELFPWRSNLFFFSFPFSTGTYHWTIFTFSYVLVHHLELWICKN